MKSFFIKYQLALGLALFCGLLSQAQGVGFKKDSLQIKAYSVITYENNEVKSLEVTKIFCGYCSEKQLKAIKEEAWSRSYIERYDKKNRLQKGKRKLALYIRISKDDFLDLKEEEENKNIPN